MRILITGAAGFAGRHLSALLLSKKGTRVYGLVRTRSKSRVLPGVKAVHADLLSRRSMQTLLAKIRPDRIYHLAAQASVAESFKRPVRTHAVNVKGTRCLLEAALKACPRARVLVSGSADEYGASGGKKLRLSENAPLVPLSPYGSSKLAQDLLARQFFLSFGLPVVRTRAFNHFGPGQSERYVIASFAKQTAMIELGRQEPELKVGNIGVVRDFTDVRDVVRAYWLALERGKVGEVYNVASGKGRKLAEVLEFYLKRSSVKIRVRVDRSKLRKTDLRRLVGDASKLRRDTGWKPLVPFERSLEDALNYWKGKLS